MTMRKIYLASDSKARKKLLEIFGMKFRVVPSGVKEKRKAVSLSFGQFVRNNARAKAEAVAKKVQRGIIIAADTVVVDGKKIYGKPKDLADARRMLKRLVLVKNVSVYSRRYRQRQKQGQGFVRKDKDIHG